MIAYANFLSTNCFSMKMTSPDQHDTFEAIEFLEDIRYVNQTIEKECQRFEKELSERIGKLDLPEGTADELINEIVRGLGTLSAKTTISNNAVNSIQKKVRKASVKQIVKSVDNTIKTSASQFVVTASELEGTKNLYPMEVDKNGVSYCWCGPATDTRFAFSPDREHRLEMQIQLYAVIKPEYLKQLRIIVDGKDLRHRITQENSQFILRSLLPARASRGETKLKIILPETHCPTDLGGNLDGRHLGIAVSEIRFGKPKNVIFRMLDRINLFSIVISEIKFGPYRSKIVRLLGRSPAG
jgi:hypothetical protein